MTTPACTTVEAVYEAVKNSVSDTASPSGSPDDARTRIARMVSDTEFFHGFIDREATP